MHTGVRFLVYFAVFTIIFRVVVRFCGIIIVRCYDVKDILERDKTSLDLFWIKDKSLADLDSLPEPDVLAADIIENLQSALESFQELQAQLGK